MLSSGAAIGTLETPAPIVDLDRLERNIARMAAYAESHGIALRPHIKTHKATGVAAQQVAAGAVGLTCATPAEAVMSSNRQSPRFRYSTLSPSRRQK